MQASEVEYAGFWVRVVAAVIDTLLIILVTLPLLFAIYGRAYFDDSRLFAGPADFLISFVAPAVAIIMFWLYKQATPGKMLMSLHVVDAETGQTLSLGQSIGRYFGYFVSTIPLALGLIWVGFDKRKQGWHDKLAGTVVVKSKVRGPAPVQFPQQPT
ncbi:MAG: RDD family protein [Burkholderiaceae bacterium]